MKKTVSMLLAVIIAALAVCTFAVSAFATGESTTTNDDPESFNTTEATTVVTTTEATTAATTAATTTATTAATTAPETTTAVAGTTEGTTKNPLDGIIGALTTLTMPDLPDITATRAPGETVIDEGDTKAPSTTKKAPAKVESAIPSTGSGIVVPAIALLALAAGTVAVVKTKKED